MDITKEAYDKAVQVLEKCATPSGFYAAYPGYQGVWARDSVITSLGASLLKDKFKETFKHSLITLANHQSEKGQIPNAVLFDVNPPKTDYKSIDSALWFIIGHYIYKKRYGSSLFNKYKPSIKKALLWLSYLDMGEDSMLEQLPTTDWQDAFPHRYGHTINTQALYYHALNLAGNKKQANKLRISTNKIADDRLWDSSLGFYLPWRWKNHNKYQEKGKWFDSLGNLLAIIFNLASNEQAEKILAHIKKSNINKPFPIKAIYPPIRRGSKEWQDYFQDCGAKSPYHYLNAGIWTFIGGFYILALIKQKKLNEAKLQLEQLAKANLQVPMFSEWIDGKTGKPGHSHSGSQEGNQAWNAGAYILAYESIKQKKILI